MLYRVSCPACGERGRIPTADLQAMPACRQCGQLLEAEPVPIERAAGEEPTIDDIVDWLSPTNTPGPSAGLATCFSCGFERLMLYESERGDSICPACLAVNRARPERSREIVLCPNCRQPIELYERDRGKTIVCPDCNYFLGCVLPPEKRRFGALPFLNALLGTAND